MHPANLPTAVTYTRDFEATELKANHAQAINLVINGLSELDFKLKQFTIQETTIVPKIKHIFQHRPISSGSQRCMSVTTVINKGTSKQTAIDAANVSNAYTSISNSDLSTAAASNISTVATNHLSTPTNSNTAPEISSNNIRQPSIQSYSKLKISNESRPWNLDTGHTQNPNFQYYLSLLVTSEDSTSNKLESNQQLLTNTIPLATISNDKSLAAIFPFKPEEITLVPLFSGAILKEKSITVMYTDVRVDDHPIKLILDSGSAGSIITRQLIDQLADGVTKTPIGEIDNFPFEVNGIVTPIKVLVMEATQYQALVGNDWLFKNQHIRVLATCGHFKTPPKEKLLIELEEIKEKPTWEAYQVSWANADHNKLPPILSWDDKKKKKRERRTYLENKLGILKFEKRKEKERNKKKSQHNLSPLYMSHILHNLRPPTIDLNLNVSLVARNCQRWDNMPCLACRETLLDKGMWNNIPGITYTIAEGATASKLQKIKTNLLFLPEPEYVATFDVFGNVEDDSEEFHKHYQQLAPTREEQEEWLAQLNT
ncbi:hypothetical protein G9A89_009816 [Geosiphon pyriformis]|nr:hypothetical protein G9A89_009816 [Geosiphon pyriformis]